RRMTPLQIRQPGQLEIGQFLRMCRRNAKGRHEFWPVVKANVARKQQGPLLIPRWRHGLIAPDDTPATDGSGTVRRPIVDKSVWRPLRKGAHRSAYPLPIG